MRATLAFLALGLLTTLTACAHKTEASEPTPTPAVSKTAADVAKPTAPAKPDADKTECTHDKETRTLTVSDKDKGCELTYNKGGKDAVVATGHKGKKHCEQASTKIQEKLTAAGYVCK